MNRVFLDGQTITQFIEDAETFNLCSVERFKALDKDGDGALTWSDLCNNLGHMFTEQERDDLLDKLFDQFDADKDGVIGVGEFKLMLKEMMMALARGIGPVPVLIAVEPGSVFMKAIDHEIELQRKKSEIAVKEEEEDTATTRREICTENHCSSAAVKEKKKHRLSSASGLFMCFVCGNHSTKDIQILPLEK